MTPVHLRELHLALVLVLGVCGIVNWRIHFKYQKVFGPEISASQQVRMLVRQGNPDGWIAIVGSAVGIFVGVALIVLTFHH
jgi:hypothetical protein